MEHVSETEMREFFARLASTFVGFSAQATELDNVKRQVEELTARVNDMAQANESLRSEVTAAYETMRKVEAERDDLRRVVSEHENTIRWRQETIDARNRENVDLSNKCTSLEAELNEVRSQLTAVRSDHEKLQTDFAIANSRISELESENTKYKADVEHWTNAYNAISDDRNALREKVRSFHDSVRTIFETQESSPDWALRVVG